MADSPLRLVSFADARPEIRRLVKRDPRMAWSLRTFFEEWFYPRVLKLQKRVQQTADHYCEALRYWEQVADDPVLAEIALDDDTKTIDFVATLAEWGYSRSGVPRGAPIRIGRLGPGTGLLPLASATMHSHVAKIATLLAKCGPRLSPRALTAEILPRYPYLPPVQRTFATKEPFELEQALAIAAACSRMERPRLPAGLTAELWWRTRIALLYYTGQRAGTLWALRWRHVCQRRGKLWLSIPAELIKTRKAIEVPVHPQLAELLTQVGRREADELILPASCGYRHFLDLHEQLQALAGIPEEERQSPHAWRRTHLSQLGLLGIELAAELARLGGDHAHARTTKQHYIGHMLAQQVLQLPRLWQCVRPSRQQRLFSTG